MIARLTLPALFLGMIALVNARDLPAVSYEKFASDFVSPLSMIPYGKGSQAYLVVDQAGVIHFLDEKGGKPGKAFLDLRKSIVTLKKGFDERGSLGVALHPKAGTFVGWLAFIRLPPGTVVSGVEPVLL